MSSTNIRGYNSWYPMNAKGNPKISEQAPKGGKARWKGVSKAARRKQALRAIRARWKAVREANTARAAIPLSVPPIVPQNAA